MPAPWRIVLIVLIGAILAAVAFAVYLKSGLNVEEPATKLGGIENFIPAREILPAPPITFLDQSGAKLSLESFRGKVVVLNLWATWCTPCVAEMPTLDRLQQQLQGLGVVVIALSIDRGGPNVVKGFYDEHGIKNLGVYVDPSMRSQFDLKVVGLPTTILIDRDGRERGRLVGPAEWDDAKAADIVLSASVPPR